MKAYGIPRAGCVEDWDKYAIAGVCRRRTKQKRRLRRVWKRVARAEQKKDCEEMKNDE